MAKMIRKVDLARMAGVAPSVITYACKKRLLPAVSGGLVDSEHPLVVQYLRERAQKDAMESERHSEMIAKAEEFMRKSPLTDRKTLAKRFSLSRNEAASIHKAATKRRGDLSEMPTTEDVPEDELEVLASWTLQELVTTFGTEERFKTWVQARKLMADVEDKVIRNFERRGKLISRDFVDRFVVGILERTFINLLTDAAQTLSVEIVAQTAAGATVEECQEVAGEILSSHIESAKASIVVALKGLD